MLVKSIIQSNLTLDISVAINLKQKHITQIHFIQNKLIKMKNMLILIAKQKIHLSYVKVLHFKEILHNKDILDHIELIKLNQLNHTM